MALRDLIIRLRTAVDPTGVRTLAGAVARVQGEADGASAAVAGIGTAATMAGEQGSAAIGQIGTSAQTASSQAAAAMRSTLLPAAGELRSRFATTFGPMASGATRAVAGIGAAVARARAQSVGLGSGLTTALAPAIAAAGRVRAAVAPMLSPIATAAVRVRGVLAQWGAGIVQIAAQAGQAIRARVTQAAEGASTAVGGFLSRLRRRAPTPAEQAPSGGKGGGGGLGSGVVAGAIGGAVAGAVMAGTRALVGYTQRTIEAAGAINDLRAATGMSAQAIQTWTPILEQAGASQGDLRLALKGLSKEIGAASEGNKGAIKTFEALGISAKSLEGKSLEENFSTVARAIADQKNETDKLNLAQSVFGRSAINLIPALEGGSAAVDEQVAKFSKLAVLTDEMVTKTDATGDAMDTLKLRFAQVAPVALSAFIPLIDTLTNTLVPLLPGLIAALEPFISMLSTGLGAVVSAVLPVLVQAFEALSSALSGLDIGDFVSQLLGAVMPAIKTLIPVLGTLISAIAPIVASLAQQLAPVLGAIASAFADVIAAVAPLLPQLVGALLPVVVELAPVFVQLAQALIPLVQQLMPALVMLVQTLTPVLGFLAEILAALLGPAIGIVSAAVSLVISAFEILVRQVALAIDALKFLWAAFTGGGEALDQASAKLDGTIEGWWNSIKAFADKVLGFFKEIWSGLFDGFDGVLASLGLVDGAEVKVALANTGAGVTARAGVSPTAGGATNTTNKALTINDQRTTKIEVSANATPAQIARETGSYVDRLMTTDRDTLMSHAEAG
jgi:hypothetical protein